MIMRWESCLATTYALRRSSMLLIWTVVWRLREPMLGFMMTGELGTLRRILLNIFFVFLQLIALPPCAIAIPAWMRRLRAMSLSSIQSTEAGKCPRGRGNPSKIIVVLVTFFVASSLLKFVFVFFCFFVIVATKISFDTPKRRNSHMSIPRRFASFQIARARRPVCSSGSWTMVPIRMRARNLNRLGAQRV